MKLEYRDGLIYASIEIKYRNKSTKIDKIVVDTGAAETMISPDIVENIGIFAEKDDRIISYYGVGGSIHNAFEKTVDLIKFNDYQTNNISIDFGVIDPKGEINGLIGLDLLIKMGAIINLKTMEIEFE